MTDITCHRRDRRGAHHECAPLDDPCATGRGWGWSRSSPSSFLFLIVPAISVFSNALQAPKTAFSLSAMGEAFRARTARPSCSRSSSPPVAAAVGVVLGTLLAYAAATATRPQVAAQPGLVVQRRRRQHGRHAAGVRVPHPARAPGRAHQDPQRGTGLRHLRPTGSTSAPSPGSIIVYSYFNIPLMVLITLPAIDGLKQSWREACSNLGGTTWTYWRRVGLPVLAPSLLGGFLLLFANSFSAYATAAALTDNSQIVSLRHGVLPRRRREHRRGRGRLLPGGVDDHHHRRSAMALYWIARTRAERWQA